MGDDPARLAQTQEEVERALRYERGLLWKAGVALLPVLALVLINLLVGR